MIVLFFGGTWGNYWTIFECYFMELYRMFCIKYGIISQLIILW